MRTSSVALTRRVLLLRILAPLVLVTGYLDLARGGMTAGPLLLVLGYLVLVPALFLEH